MAVKHSKITEHYYTEDTTEEKQNQKDNSSKSLFSPVVESNQKKRRDNIQLHIDSQIPGMTQALQDSDR